MEAISDLDLGGIQTFLFWAILLLLVYVLIGAVWGYWLGKLKDEMGRTPTLAEGFRRLVSRSKSS